MTTRFTRHFTIICMPPTPEDSLSDIFKPIVYGWLEYNSFKKDVLAQGQNIVDSTTCLYIDIANTLKPTPAKSHYTFNLRDVAKVFQGILMSSPQSVNQQEIIARLWIHEVLRVFHDRLINE